MTATQIHNLYGPPVLHSFLSLISYPFDINSGRGFSEWPGIWCIFHIHGPSRDDYVRVRLVTTRILSSSSSLSSPLPSPSPSILEPISPSNQVTYRSISGTKNGYLEVGCMDNSRLAILELQPQGKKVMTAKAFKNGLKEKKVSWYPILETDDSHHIQADRDSH
jgi:methionyl-tRNA formyltransferase